MVSFNLLRCVPDHTGPAVAWSARPSTAAMVKTDTGGGAAAKGVQVFFAAETHTIKPYKYFQHFITNDLLNIPNNYHTIKCFRFILNFIISRSKKKHDATPEFPSSWWAQVFINPPAGGTLGKWPSSRVALMRSKIFNALDAPSWGT